MMPFPDFTTFFREIWGYDPFPWQRRLAGQITAGPWPEWITLPTGTGKTTAIDIAIYHLACQAGHAPGERTAPVRIVFAVNRRIVVDEAYERAKVIAKRLKAALTNPNDILQPVALALQALSGIKGGAPLETYPLRGATFTDHSWARTPTQPLVISTTLDQLGSRLLFRGYGVSPYARPIHAALLANDALLILDEAHTAKAFSQTLGAVAKLRQQPGNPMQPPFAAVQLTATPPAGVGDPFALDQDDRLHPLIKARLGASKPAELVLVQGATGKTARHKRLAEEMAEKAITFIADGHPRVLIVVNRVATAEALKAKLEPEKGAKGHEADVHILTGRLRPLDRENLIQQLTGKYQLKSSSPTADAPKLILIATQCIEVGADYDFDALLTELAPLDNLRQRFGRLNRQGREIPAPAAIFAPEEALDQIPLKQKCKLALSGKNSDFRTRVLVNNDRDVEELTKLLETREIDSNDQNSAKGMSIRWIGSATEEDVERVLAQANENELRMAIGEIALPNNGIGSTIDNENSSVVFFVRGEFKKQRKAQWVEFVSLPIVPEESETEDEDLQKLVKKIFGKAKKSRLIVVRDSGECESERVQHALAEFVFVRPIRIELARASDSCEHLSEILAPYSDCEMLSTPVAPRVVLVHSRQCSLLPDIVFSQTVWGATDPLYGECLPETWAWLHNNSKGERKVDFGYNALTPLIQKTLRQEELLAPALDAPLLLEPHLDLFCQTSPEPQVSPEPSLYIHGPGRSFPEVSVVLRADLGDGNDPLEMLRAAPPNGTEGATVPLRLAREWLENPDKATDSGGDAPDSLDDAWSRGKVNVPNAFRWNADEASPLVASPNELRPGDVLVIPAQTPWEWLKKLFPVPHEKTPWALDQYERAHLLSRDRLCIRFHSAVRSGLETSLTEEAARSRYREITAPLFARDEEEGRWIFREADWIKAMPDLASLLAEHLPAEHSLKSLWNHAAFIKPGTPRPAADWKAAPYLNNSLEGVVFTNRSRVGATPWPFDPDNLGRQGNGGTESVSLAEHSDSVAKRAASNASGLPAGLMQTLRDAGAWHDLGKLDPRFQALLHGCSLWAVETKPQLAKSGRRSPAMEKFYRKLSALPDGFRHELLSALIIAQSEIGKHHPERELLLHLIASHHGRCRSMAPVIHDPTPEPFDVSIAGETLRYAGQDHPLAHLSEGVARRFWNLNRRFGWWGLPYLEAMLRLADQYESANAHSTSPS